MDDERLILLVRERNEIYNRSNPLFKNVHKKQEAWKDIANELGTTADDCMKRWTLLRDRFTRECKRIEESNGSAPPSMWCLFEMMQFIKPYTSFRTIRSSIFSRNKLASNIKKHNMPPALVKKPIPSSPTPLTSVLPVTSTIECENINKLFYDPLIESPMPPKNTIISNADVDSSFCEAVEILKKACALNEDKNVNSAVHAFGEMIVSTICSMNSRNQLKVMQQVTDTVMRIKLEEDETIQVSYSSL